MVVIDNMHKRVLLAEESDTVRGVAESALRQNGFEVISVVSGEKAIEVLELSRPDLIIVGSELVGKGRKPVYEYVQENPKSSSVPLLVLANPEEAGLPFPQEVIVSRPLEPNEFMAKVNAFIGQSAVVNQAESNPLSEAQLEDELLDAALGLDQIDVTDSEVMDKTQVPSKKNAQKMPEKPVSFDSYDRNDDVTESGKVESLMIRDENAEIGHADKKDEKGDSMSSSGKLEILNDQYGLIDENAADLQSEDSAHDYHWFVNSLKTDSQGPPASEPTPGTTSQQGQPSELTFSEPSSMVDPMTPDPEDKPVDEPKSVQNAGVDNFIDEFKKEIDKIRTDEPESITIGDAGKGQSSQVSLSWQDSLEKMTPEQIGIFTQQFIKELADKIAQLIAAKIDSDKLLNMLKKEIISRIEKKQ